MDFWKSKEWQELSGLLTTAYLPGATVGGQYLGLLSVRTPDGKIVLAAAVFDDIYPGSNFIDITDEKLLAKLRNIKGQFHNVAGTDDLPVFYYEYLMSTADFKVFSKTGKLPVVTEKERPERDRLADEIMKLLIKRQTNLADGIDALTTVKINVLKDNYEGARTNELNLLSSDFYEDVRGFSESMKNYRFCLIPRKGFVEDAEHVVVKRDRVYFASAKQLWHRIGQALARGGTNLRNNLGQGGGAPERVRPLAIEIRELLSKRRTSRTTLGDALDALTTPMLTAIEATHGREKADEFDLLMARFSEGVRRLSGERVQ
ncbi:MAG: hypothetical protein WAN76_08655 [Candidatus Sulfotelmatobacter sp.]